MGYLITHPFIGYFILISTLSFVACVYDKIVSKFRVHPKFRIPEASLLLLAALGGAPVMYVTMQIIRHKTLHKKFMIGIPVIMAVQLILVILYFYFTK